MTTTMIYITNQEPDRYFWAKFTLRLVVAIGVTALGYATVMIA